MANTDVQICSNALTVLGSKSIDSLTEGTGRAKICNAVYDDIKYTLLASYPWRFATRKAKLSRDATAPINEWRYSFILPTDRVENGAIAAFQSSAVSEPPFQDFEIFENRLYANVEEVWIDYTYDIVEASMPFYFVNLLKAAICADIAMAVTDQVNLANYWQQKAYGSPSENMTGGLTRIARNTDASFNVSSGVVATDLIDVRMF